MASLVLVVLLVVIAAGLTPDGVRWLRTEVPGANYGMGWLELKSGVLNAPHVLLFFAVGVALALAMLPGRPILRAGLAALLLLAAIAVASEAVQLAIPGRTPRLTDIRDDLLGGIAGLSLGLLLRAAWRYWRRR